MRESIVIVIDADVVFVAEVVVVAAGAAILQTSLSVVVGDASAADFRRRVFINGRRNILQQVKSGFFVANNLTLFPDGDVRLGGLRRRGRRWKCRSFARHFRRTVQRDVPSAVLESEAIEYICKSCYLSVGVLRKRLVTSCSHYFRNRI